MCSIWRSRFGPQQQLHGKSVIVSVKYAAESAADGSWNSEGVPGVLNVTCFSNKTHFHLDGCINKERV